MIELTEELQERVDLIKHKLKFIEQKPAVACITQLDSLQFAGDNLAQSISIAGGDSVASLDANPDIIIVMPTGYALEEIIREIGALLQSSNFTDQKAIKNNRLYIADGTRYANTPDSIVDEIEMLAEMINPKQFIFGNEGEAWVKFSL